MVTIVNCNYKLDKGGTWLVADDVWFLTFCLKFSFVRVEKLKYTTILVRFYLQGVS
jgi:hypothetical protein